MFYSTKNSDSIMHPLHNNNYLCEFFSALLLVAVNADATFPSTSAMSPSTSLSLNSAGTGCPD